MSVWVTYDYGTNVQFSNETDQAHAVLPILKPPTKKVGVSNGGVSVGTHVTRLPFTQLYHKASTEETFTDYPNSFVSVGKTANDYTVSVFTKDKVKV